MPLNSLNHWRQYQKGPLERSAQWNEECNVFPGVVPSLFVLERIFPVVFKLLFVFALHFLWILGEFQKGIPELRNIQFTALSVLSWEYKDYNCFVLKSLVLEAILGWELRKDIKVQQLFWSNPHMYLWSFINEWALCLCPEGLHFYYFTSLMVRNECLLL